MFIVITPLSTLTKKGININSIRGIIPHFENEVESSLLNINGEIIPVAETMQEIIDQTKVSFTE